MASIPPAMPPNQQSVVSKPIGTSSKTFSIQDFRAHIKTAGILPKHSFLVIFSKFQPGKLASRLNKYITNAEQLTLRCESVNLPVPTLYSEEVRRFGAGPAEQAVWGVQFNQDLSMSFIVDSEATQVKFFDDWMNLIVNYDSKGGSDINKPNNLNYLPYEVGYKDDYSNLQMNIFVYDQYQIKVMAYEVYDVFPVAINTVDLDWGDTDQPLRLTVRFAFTDFVVNTPKFPSQLTQDSGEIVTKSSQGEPAPGSSSNVSVGGAVISPSPLVPPTDRVSVIKVTNI